MRLLFFIFIFSIAPACFIVIVDPYETWHNSFINEDLITENERYRNAGLIRKHLYTGLEPGTVLVGTSMSQNIYVNDIKDAFGIENAVRLVTSGAFPPEQFAQVDYALKSNNVDTLIWEVYRNWVSPNYNRPNGNYDFPFYLYDRSIFNDGAVLFNHSMVLSAIDRVYGEKRMARFNWSNNRNTVSALHPRALSGGDYRDWISLGNQSAVNNKRDQILENIDLSTINFNKAGPDTLNNYVEPLIRAYPSVKFIFFTPPVSTVRGLEDLNSGALERKFKLEKDLFSLSEQYDNVELISLNREFAITNDMTNYKDPGHFDKETSLWVVNSLANTPLSGTIVEDQESYLQQLHRSPIQWPGIHQHIKQIIFRVSQRDGIDIGGEVDVRTILRGDSKIESSLFLLTDTSLLSQLRQKLSADKERYIIAYIPQEEGSDETLYIILSPDYYSELRFSLVAFTGVRFEDTLRLDAE